MEDVIFFTGSRTGYESVADVIMSRWIGDLLVEAQQSNTRVKFIHGCCIGADEGFHSLLATMLKRNWIRYVSYVDIELFPSNLPQYTAYDLDMWLGCPIVLHKPKPPLTRNLDMARMCRECWATPATDLRSRGGTWHAISQVESFGKPVRYPLKEK